MKTWSEFLNSLKEAQEKYHDVEPDLFISMRENLSDMKVELEYMIDQIDKCLDLEYVADKNELMFTEEFENNHKIYVQRSKQIGE